MPPSPLSGGAVSLSRCFSQLTYIIRRDRQPKAERLEVCDGTWLFSDTLLRRGSIKSGEGRKVNIYNLLMGKEVKEGNMYPNSTLKSRLSRHAWPHANERRLLSVPLSGLCVLERNCVLERDRKHFDLLKLSWPHRRCSPEYPRVRGGRITAQPKGYLLILKLQDKEEREEERTRDGRNGLVANWNETSLKRFLWCRLLWSIGLPWYSTFRSVLKFRVCLF